jgi:hypothetical protein
VQQRSIWRHHYLLQLKSMSRYPKGAELSTLSPLTSEQFREFVSMNEEERIEAGNQMSEREKNQIMLEFSKMNSSISNVNESMDELRPD